MSGGTTQKAVVPAYLTWVDVAGIPQQMLFDLVEGEDYDFGADVTEHPVETGSDITDNVRVRTDEATLELVLTNEPIADNIANTSSPRPQMVQAPQPLSVPTPPLQPPGNPTVEYDVWANMITEKALLTGAGGFAGGALGGATGSLVGAAAGGVLGALLLQPHKQPTVQPIQAGPSTVGGTAPIGPITANTFSFPTGDEDFVAKTINSLRTMKDNAQLFDIIAPKLVIESTVITAIKIHRGQAEGTGARLTLTMKQIRFVNTTTVPAPTPTVVNAKPPVNLGEQNPVPATPQQTSSAAVNVAALLTGTSPFGSFSLGPGVGSP